MFRVLCSLPRRFFLQDTYRLRSIGEFNVNRCRQRVAGPPSGIRVRRDASTVYLSSVSFPIISFLFINDRIICREVTIFCRYVIVLPRANSVYILEAMYGIARSTYFIPTYTFRRIIKSLLCVMSHRPQVKWSTMGAVGNLPHVKFAIMRVIDYRLTFKIFFRGVKTTAGIRTCGRYGWCIGLVRILILL